MKSISAKLVLAALFASAAVTASAANPFSDVAPGDWSYQAVEKLAAEGVVEGYPDGSFKGEKPITRYEMSQIVAKLMAREDTLTASQKADVEKLSAAYADELKNLGVRVAELEKKAPNFQTIMELQFSYQPVYNNIYTGDKEGDVYGARLRLHNIAAINDRTTLYGTLESFTGLGGTEYHDLNDYSRKEDDFHLHTLFTTYHFGGRDGNNQGRGPSKDIIAIGEFPVRMGVTGYTYDGRIKGAMIQFGDYKEGGKFTLAYGRASDINYDYTGPMMRGVHGMKPLIIDPIKTQLGQLVQAGQLKPGVAEQIGSMLGQIQSDEQFESAMADLVKKDPNLAPLAKELQGKLSSFKGKYDWVNDRLYPMAPDVRMAEGEDEDVPVAYMSYIYKKPKSYEFHLYGMKAVGPVSHIAQAYGAAASWYVTDDWNVHGEYVKNTRYLPLNGERPHSFNYGISYGTADVLQEKSFSLGVDYVYSQAGTYFGGSSSDIAGQYMGHVYNNWHGMGRMPAYIADKLDAVMNGTDSPDANYGGAKFFLAKAQYVPKKGLILEASYGFGAKDMGGRKMDDMFRLQATMYYK